MEVIRFQDVWEMYRIKFRENKRADWENFWALKGIDFSVQQGECVGLIGENGAGKSTILKLIAKVLIPDRGEVAVSGNVSGLLELGAGFDLDMSGKENIDILANLYDSSSHKESQKIESIIQFADIGKFIYAPVKSYSSFILGTVDDKPVVPVSSPCVH